MILSLRVLPFRGATGSRRQKPVEKQKRRVQNATVVVPDWISPEYPLFKP